MRDDKPEITEMVQWAVLVVEHYTEIYAGIEEVVILMWLISLARVQREEGPFRRLCSVSRKR